MLWITLRTDIEIQYLDVVNFLIQEDGTFNILLMDGSSIKGEVKDIKFLHVEQVIEN
jgi:hypothetical protein